MAGSPLALDRSLEQLRTVQLLETTIGPQTVRQLESILAERSTTLLNQIEEDRRRNRALLEVVIDEWARLGQPQPAPAPEPTQPGRLSREEVLSGFIDLKRSQADVLRGALENAPTDRLRALLEEIIQREEATADALRALLGPRPGSGAERADASDS
jgi:hypothetical protein